MPQDEFRSEMPATEARPAPREAGAGSPNEALVRRVHAAFHRGDLEAIGQELADDATWHIPGKNVVAGLHRGRDAILAMMRKVGEASGGTYHADLLAAFGDENYGVLWVRATAAKGDRHLEQYESLVFAICDGKITEVWGRPDTDRFDAFFA